MIYSELLKKVGENLLEYGSHLPKEFDERIINDKLIIDEVLKILNEKAVKATGQKYVVSKSDYDWLMMNRPLRLPSR